MKTTIDSAEEANELCVKLWDLIEAEFGDDVNEHSIPTAKRRALLQLGYEDITANCPLCGYYGDDCGGCPIDHCNAHGYCSVMNGERIKKFNAFIKERMELV